VLLSHKKQQQNKQQQQKQYSDCENVKLLRNYNTKPGKNHGTVT
jgi:hypothetical protein